MAEAKMSYAAVAANTRNTNVQQQVLSQEELPPHDSRNYRLQTVILDRPYTATFGCRDGQIPLDVVFKYFEQIKIQSDVKCINNISKSERETVLEITFKDFATPSVEKIEENILRHQGLSFVRLDTRELKDVKVQPLTRVMIYEAPYELDNKHIFNKLRVYGEIADQSIYMHKYKNTGILNGVRSITFLKLTKPVPTTLFIKGNLVKLRHNGQDRTPFCTLCKTKGHYRLDCPELNNQWQAPAMDWAQEVESSETNQPRGGEQQPTQPRGGEQQQVETESSTQSSTEDKSPTASLGEGSSNSNKQQISSEKLESDVESHTPDQEWQEIRRVKKHTINPENLKRNSSQSEGLTQIMGQFFTQETKSANKRKGKPKNKSGKKTQKTEVEYNKYSSSSSFDASDERSSESSSDESTITESNEN